MHERRGKTVHCGGQRRHLLASYIPPCPPPQCSAAWRIPLKQMHPVAVRAATGMRPSRWGTALTRRRCDRLEGAGVEARAAAPRFDRALPAADRCRAPCGGALYLSSVRLPPPPRPTPHSKLAPRTPGWLLGAATATCARGPRARGGVLGSPDPVVLGSGGSERAGQGEEGDWGGSRGGGAHAVGREF